MYAIVEIAGFQFKVENGRKLYVHRLSSAEGATVSFDKVLLVDNDGKVQVGAPLVQDATVEAKVIRHLKDDKVIIFKKNRRKGYRVKNGHRQSLTQIEISNISLSGSPKAAKTEAPKVEAPKVEAPKAEKPVAAKKPAAPKADKPAAPKAPAKPKTPKTEE